MIQLNKPWRVQVWKTQISEPAADPVVSLLLNSLVHLHLRRPQALPAAFAVVAAACGHLPWKNMNKQISNLECTKIPKRKSCRKTKVMNTFVQILPFPSLDVIVHVSAYHHGCCFHAFLSFLWISARLTKNQDDNDSQMLPLFLIYSINSGNYKGFVAERG